MDLEALAGEVFDGPATGGSADLDSLANEVYSAKPEPLAAGPKALPGASALLGPAPARAAATPSPVPAEATGPAFGGANIKKTTPARVQAATDRFNDVTEVFKGGAVNIGSAIADLGRKTGVLTDPAEETYIQQNARDATDVDRVRAEYQARKKQGGVMFQGEAPAGRLPVGEINRPVGPTMAEEEDAGYRQGIEEQMRNATPQQRAEAAAAPIPRRVGPPARAAAAQIDRENMNPALALTTEGRVARRQQQGMSGPDAQASIDMERALQVPDRGPLQQAKQSTVDLERARQMQGASFGSRVAEGTGDLVGMMDAGRAMLVGELSGDDDVVAGAMARFRQRRTSMQELDMGTQVGDVQKWFEKAGQSVVLNVPALLLAPVSGGASLGMMGVQSMMASFAEETANNPTAPLNQRMIKSGVDGVLEIVGERIGMPSFLRTVRATVNPNIGTAEYASIVAKHILREIPGEEVTYAGQYINDLLRPYGGVTEASLTQFLIGAADTMANTIVQAGVLGGAGYGVNRALQAATSAGGASQQVARAIQQSVDSAIINQEGVDAAARAALDPSMAGMVRVGAPPPPPPPPAAVTLAGLTKAMNDPRPIAQQEADRQAQERATAEQAAQQEQQALLDQYGLQPPGSRVTAQMEGTPPITGTIESVSPSDQGGYEARLRTDDGELYIVNGEDNTLFRPVAIGDGTRKTPLKAEDGRDIDAAVDQNTHPDPTGPQIDAENYPMTHLSWNGSEISVETAKGGTRKARDGSWEVKDFPAHYGRFKGTIGMDGQHLDVYMGPNPKSNLVVVIDQIDAETLDPDEHKVMAGFDTVEDAQAAWERAFSDGRAHDRAGHVAEMTVQQFNDWKSDPKNLLKPIGYVKPAPPKVEEPVADKPLTQAELEAMFDEVAGEEAPPVVEPPAVEFDHSNRNPDIKTVKLPNRRHPDTATPTAEINTLKLPDGTFAYGYGFFTLNGGVGKPIFMAGGSYETAATEALAQQAAAVEIIKDAASTLRRAEKETERKEARDALNWLVSNGFATSEQITTAIGEEGEKPPTAETDTTDTTEPGVPTPEREEEEVRPEEIERDIAAEIAAAPTIETKEEYQDFKGRYGLANRVPAADGGPMFGKGAVYFVDDDADGKVMGKTLVDPADLPSTPKVDKNRKETETHRRDLARTAMAELAAQPEMLTAFKMVDNPDAFMPIAAKEVVRWIRKVYEKSDLTPAERAAADSMVVDGKAMLEKEWYESLYNELAAAQKKAEAERKRQMKENIQNTGEAIRRIMDGAKKDAADAAEWSAIERMTNRARFFDGLLDKDATPGARAMLDNIRAHIRPFLEWAHSRSGPLTNDYSDTNTENVAHMMRNTDGAAEVRDAAVQYIELLRPMIEKLQGAKSVADLNAAIDTLTGDGDSLTKWRKSFNGMFRGTWLERLKQSKASDIGVNENNQAFFDAQKRRELRPPRIEKVVAMKDHRGGKDISAEDFKKHFGFVNVQFGEYVTNEEGQRHLNASYDAFMDLVDRLKMPPKAISLGGWLHFSIGALGHGKHAAHFEMRDGVAVINLTKTQGDGTVAHEWAHALDHRLRTLAGLGDQVESIRTLVAELRKGYDYDNILAAAVRGLKGESFMRYRGRQRPMYDLKTDEGRINNAIDLVRYYRGNETSQFQKNALALDGLKSVTSKAYWSNGKEMFARAWEAFILDTLGGVSNYLVHPEFVGEGLVTGDNYRGTPYAAGDERQRHNKMFEGFAKALRWTEDGVPSLDDATINEAAKETNAAFEKVIERLRGDLAKMLEDIKDEQAGKDFERKQIEAESMRMKVGDWVAIRSPREGLDSTPKKIAFRDVRPAANRRDVMSVWIGFEGDQRAHAYAGSYKIVPEPQAEQAEVKADLTGDLTKEQLEAMFDEVAAQNAEATAEQPDAPAPGERTINPKWAREDVEFILAEIEKGRIVLVGDTDLGIHTIHGIAGARHLGFGTFKASTQDFEITFDGGGAMQRTPGGQSYTIAHVNRGTFPYDRDKYVARLKEWLARTGPKAAPTRETLDDKTAGQLAKDLAKDGITGIDEALSGLVELFGGNRIKSFPSGFDEEAYKKAKPHFQAALAAFQRAGKTLQDLMKWAFEKFGAGIKPYVVRFAMEQKLTKDLGGKVSATKKIADWVMSRLNEKKHFKGPDLWKIADEAYGGTVSSGAYTPKDAYDAMEAGMNLFLIANANLFSPMVNLPMAQSALGTLETYLSVMATQSVRTDETDAMQQFSTPPNYSYVANWVANLREGDVYFEPSAGVGGLASFAYGTGITVMVNELSARRAAVLAEVMPGARMFTENGEQLHNILPADVVPTVVVMNPPFSATVRGGKNESINGATHIEQMLKRLPVGGRLVAIMGEGMAADRPAFKEWWAEIRKKYNVRANVGVNGENYRKYGTTFDNQIIVIDKDGPTTEDVVVGKFDDLAEVLKVLEGVRNDRPTSNRKAEPATDQPGGDGKTPPGMEGPGQGGGAGISPPGTGSGAGTGGSGGGGSGSGGTSTQPPRGNGAGKGNGVSGGGRGRRGGSQSGNDQGSTDQQGGDSGTDVADGNTDGQGTGVDLEKAEKINRGDISDSIYENYIPAKVKIAGAVAHPGLLVESAAMAAVDPVDPTYTPNLPKEVITEGLLSLPQLEVVVYAGQAHEQFLRNGDRRGFFIGDGTGVGKGREIAGIIFDNWRQGRKKHVWLSEKPSLFKAAQDDYEGVTGTKDPLFYMPAAGEKITQKTGIIFLPYSTLRVGMATSVAANANRTTLSQAQLTQVYPAGSAVMLSSDRIGELVTWSEKNHSAKITYRGATLVVRFDEIIAVKPLGVVGSGGFRQGWGHISHAPQTKKSEKKEQARIDQLGEWLGPEFDGVIAFDESHNLGNTGIGSKKDASQQALAGLALQERFPKARIVYVSATGATEINNLTYAQRLGMWGDGTPFAGPNEFIGSISKGGVAALELVSQNLKATGSYLARNLSFEGVEHNRLQHDLNEDQRTVYNELAKAWQIVLQNMEAALDMTGGRKAAGVKGRTRSLFWSTQQRFFNQVITSMLMPTAIDKAKAQIAAGETVVFQMVNTNEAAQERAVERAEQEGVELEELDFTPKESLIEMIRKAYPTNQYEERVDEDGKETMVLVVDSQGQPVQNAEAVAARDALIENIEKHLKVPDNPLDLIISEFGHENVAEISGRGRRFVKAEQEDGGFKLVQQTRSRVIADAEAAEFMDDKRRVLVFTGAGSTGRSFQSDFRVKNQRRRAHFIVQSGWRADQTTQGFGRTHRSNEANQPFYYLCTTDITAQKRFITSIARRLDQLGALTKGQRETGSQGMFNAADNLEGPYSHGALRGLLEDIAKGSVLERDVISEMGLDDAFDEKDPTKLIESKIPDVPKFLNRLLSLTLDRQNEVFDEFFNRIDAAVEGARAAGTLDKGIETVRAMSVKKVRDEVVYTDERTKATARFLELDLVQPTIINAWSDALEESRDGEFLGFFRRPTDQRVFVVVSRGTKVDAWGRTQNTGYMLGVKNKRSWTDALLTIEKGTDRSPKWTKLTHEEAQKAWEAELTATPKIHSEKMHLLSGALLGIWDRIEGDPKIKRVATSDGERFIGRELRGKNLEATMKNLGVGSTVSKMTPAQIHTEVMSQKGAAKSVKLANGWRLIKTRVRSEDRMELESRYFSQAEMDQLRRNGWFSEKIDFKTRFFLPTDNIQVLSELLADKPAVEIIDPKTQATDDDDDGAQSNIVIRREEDKFTKRVPIDAILDEMEARFRQGDAYTVQKVDVVKELREMYNAGAVSDDQIFALLAKIDARRAGKVAVRMATDRVRGYDQIMSKMHAAVRAGDLSAQELELTKWFMDHNPDMVERLAISIQHQTKRTAGIAGQYFPDQWLMRLFKGAANDGTAVHEILHHTERMLPRVVRDGIITVWLRELSRKQADKTTTPAESAAIDAILRANAGDTRLLRTMVRTGKFPGSVYSLVNPSEFWAVNAAEIMRERFGKPRWLRVAYQWYQEFISFTRGLFGLPNNFPVMRGLRAVFNTDGVDLHDTQIYQDAGTQANINGSDGGSLFNITQPQDPALFNGGRRLVDDMWSITRKLVHPRMVASRRAGIAKIFDYADRQDQRAKEIISELSEMYVPTLEKLSDKQKEILFGVLERGRLYAKFYGVGRGSAIVADDPDGRARIMPGETLTVDDEEIKAAYYAARRAMNRALELYKQQFIEDAGYDPAVITRATDVMALMTTGISDLEGRRLERLAMALVEIEQAKRRGYVPFNRFGEVGIWVRERDPDDPDVTAIVHFEAVELGMASRAKNMLPLKQRPAMEEFPEVAARVAALRTEYPDAEIGVADRTRLRPEDKVDLAGVNGLAQVAEVDPTIWDQVYQQLLEATKKKGFRKHLLGSDEVTGYSLDFERGFADYVTGLGGFLARRRYAKKAEDAIAKIDAPNEHEYAERYWKYINRPGQELARLRQVTFLYYIVGGVGSAITNASQPWLVTLPYLSQFTNPARSTAAISRAWAESLTMLTVADWKDVSQLKKSPDMFDPDKAPADVRDALKAAWNEGFFVPLNVNDVIAVASETSQFRRGGGKMVDTAIEDLAILFASAERMNRLVTFIAAHRVAQIPGVADRISRTLADNELAKRQLFTRGQFTPADFARWTVEETQYVMGKLNRPEAMRGAGTAIFQFMGFTVQTIELMWRMGLQNTARGKVALGLMLVLLFAAAGLWELPGADNLRDIVEWAYKKWTKLDLDTRTMVYEAVQRLTGSRRIATAVNKGALSEATGIDWSQRLGLGDIIKTKIEGDTPIDWERLAGVNYDMWVKRPMRAFEAYERGDTKGMVANLLPNFLGNPMTSLAWQEGGIRAAKTGNVVIPPEQVTKGQAALKMAGFTPLDISMRRERLRAQDRVRFDMPEIKKNFYLRLGVAGAAQERARNAGNQGLVAIQEARIGNIVAEIEKHNATHPTHQQVIIDPKTVRTSVLRELEGEATRKTPKLMRERVEEIRQAYER